MNHITSQRGFTLIELMLYLGIASTVLLVSTMFVSTMLEARVKNRTIAEVEEQGMLVMQLVTQTIRNAENITMPAAGQSASSLVLDVSASGDDPTTFFVSSGTVYVTEGSGAAIPLTNTHVIVSDFAVRNVSNTDTPGAVHVSYTLTHANVSGRYEYAYAKIFSGGASLRQP